ncbi:MAG: hypothetical protein GX096_03575 [Clostridiales bacterium]|nr:hypothetical protein [Clostridiales bacterium]
MNQKIFSRMFALLLCLCLLPLSALAVSAEDDMTVTRSDFSLQVGGNADAFPQGQQSSLEAWEIYLKKIKLQGTVDTQRFLQPFSRVYFDGGLYLKDTMRLPFEYDGYYSFRYIKSPALAGSSVHFQMFNFFEFMLKPYYFMDVKTPYLALLMYPEASYIMAETFLAPIDEALAGEGSREVSYDALYALCEQLSAIAYEDIDYNQIYIYFTTMFIDLYSDDMYSADVVLEFLYSLESTLEYLDPEQKGMQITVDGDDETYTIGDTVVLSKTATSVNVHIPTPNGSDISFEYRYTSKDVGADLYMNFTWIMDEVTQVEAVLDAQDLPKEGETEAIGTVSLSLDGALRRENPLAGDFAFRYSRDAQEMPYNMSLGIDWIHPQTNEPALTLLYKAAMEQLDESALVDRPYDNQEDFFCLNESSLAEYEERFVKSIALAVMPFVIELPADIMADAIGLLNGDTSLLMLFGVY